MNSNKLLDAYKAHHGIKSDYALAARLRITRGAVNFWRKNGLPEKTAFQFATELHFDPAAVLAAVRADHATDAAIKKTWEKVARTMASRAAVFAFAALSLLIFSAPQPAQASYAATVRDIHYANFRRWLRGLIYRLTARFLHHPQQLPLL